MGFGRGFFLKKSSGRPDWLIAFLGNPGPRYAGTRHNAGFMAADVLAESLGTKIIKSKFKALTAQVKIGDADVLLLKPQTYMNNSGVSVAAAAGFYKIPNERVIVVSDEMALPVGRIRVRPGGSAGGHNGLSSIIACLGSSDFPRVRIGIGQPPHPDFDSADWVLGSFKNKDAELIAKSAALAAEAAKTYISRGSQAAMSEFNGNPLLKKEAE